MKKLFLSLAMVAFCSASFTVNSSNVAPVKVTAGSVPEEVLITFDNVVHDIMNNWYPNASYNSGNVAWERSKGNWTATGQVMVNGSNQGIDIVSSYFKNTGEFVSLNYNVIQ